MNYEKRSLLSLFSLLLPLLFLVNCSSNGLQTFGFTGVEGVVELGADVDGDGVADSVIIDGDVVPIISPDPNSPPCYDLNSNGSCDSNEPTLDPTPPGGGSTPPVIPPLPGCDDPDNDGICGTADKQPNTAILLKIISNGVSSASGELTFDNDSSVYTLVDENDFHGEDVTFCFLINAKVGSNEFVGLELHGSPGDELAFKIYTGSNGSALLAACQSDPASAGTLACDGSVVRGSGSSTPVEFFCDL